MLRAHVEHLSILVIVPVTIRGCYTVLYSSFEVGGLQTSKCPPSLIIGIKDHLRTAESNENTSQDTEGGEDG